MSHVDQELMTLPVLGAIRMVVYPAMQCSISLPSPVHQNALRERLARATAPTMFAVFAANAGATPEAPSELLYRIGTRAKVLDLVQHRGCGRWFVELVGVAPLYCFDLTNETPPFLSARCKSVHDAAGSPLELDALTQAIRHVAQQLVARHPQCGHARRALELALKAKNPADFPGVVNDLLLHLPLGERQQLLEMRRQDERLTATLVALKRRLAPSAAEMN